MSSTTLDLTSFDFALKEHYVAFNVKNMVYKDHPFHAMLPKDEKFGGDVLPLPMIYGNPQGRSATFSNAQAQKSSTKGIKFLLTRKQDYSLANIDNETMEASMGDSDAFMRAATTEIDGAIDSAAGSLATAEFRSGSGTIGKISSGSVVGSNTITLADPNDVVNFEVGQTIGASATDGASPRSGSAIITGIDRDAGTLTASASNWSTAITALAAGDCLYVSGDMNKKIQGLDAWIPLDRTVLGTSFLGVDRTQDASRLAGCYLDRTGVPIEEVAIDLATRIGREGGQPNVGILNFDNFGALEKALGSKVQYVNLKASDADIGFQGIQVIGPKGRINFVADQSMFGDRMYQLQLDTWKLYSLGAAPRILQSDGMKFLRNSSADSVEVRVGYYAQMGCVAPGWNGVAKLS
jgi:hypothetical protein